MYRPRYAHAHLIRHGCSGRQGEGLQSRPLGTLYPVVYLDCIHMKVRDARAVHAKAIYLALGINMVGKKALLGIWITQTKGAKFWLQVATKLKNRGVQDIFIACVDGLRRLPGAIGTAYPKADRQIVHHLYGTVQPELRELEVAQGSRARPACHLRGLDGEGSRAMPERIRGERGNRLPANPGGAAGSASPHSSTTRRRSEK